MTRKATIIRNKIISDTPNTTGDMSMDADIMFNGNMFEMFRPTSEVEVKEIIIKSPIKSCDLGPLPTWLSKKCVDQLLPLITAIVNRSMDESVMPLRLKRATITPLFKRPALSTHICMIVEVKNQVTILPFRLHCAKPQHSKKEITVCRHCAISVPDFIQNIKSSATLLCTGGAVDELVEACNSGVKFLINKHASLQRKTITLRTNAPWYTEELRE